IRRTMISQIVDSDARERLSRIALVRPKRAREIEDMLIRMAQTGQLRGRVSEEQLIGVLDQIERAEAGPIQSNTSSNKIKVCFVFFFFS
ncbi:PDCD5-related protein, partial [Phakopsora pachyrhizi]